MIAVPLSWRGGNARRIRAGLDQIRRLLASIVGVNEARDLVNFGGLVLVQAVCLRPVATLHEVAAALRLAAEIATAAAELQDEEGTSVAEATALLAAIVAGASSRKNLS